MNQSASSNWLQSTRWQLAMVLLPLLLYAAALNPFFAPGSYDEVLYYTGAVSLVEEGSFKFRGLYISDWPPGFSALLAVGFSVFGSSVWLAKVCVLLCAGVGLMLALRLFQKEQRQFPLVTLLLFALLPFSFSTGTRILSEWPYFAASMLFLLALERARDTRHPARDALIAGLCLGAASLTKFTGVLLGAAIMAQCIGKWRRAERSQRLRSILPEIGMSTVGAGLFLAWKAKIQLQIANGTAAPYEYYRSGFAPEHFGWIEPMSLPEKISDLFFRGGMIMETLGVHGWMAQFALTLPGMLVFIGLAARLSSKERTPADWYSLTLLAVFASFADNKQTRYLMPIAPFLVNYALLGGQRVGQWLNLTHLRSAVWSARTAICGWIFISLALATHLLFAGSPNGKYRGLCYFVNGTLETFYEGYWLDFYRACQLVQRDPTNGSIAVIGGEDKYVTYFTRRHWIDFSPAAEFAFLLVLNGDEPSREEVSSLNLECVERFETIVLYKRHVLPAVRKSSSNPGELTENNNNSAASHAHN